MRRRSGQSSRKSSAAATAATPPQRAPSRESPAPGPMQAKAGVAPKAKPAAARAAINDFLQVIMTPFRLLMPGQPLLERGVQRLRRSRLGQGTNQNDCLLG